MKKRKRKAVSAVSLECQMTMKTLESTWQVNILTTNNTQLVVGVISYSIPFQPLGLGLCLLSEAGEFARLLQADWLIDSSNRFGHEAIVCLRPRGQASCHYCWVRRRCRQSMFYALMHAWESVTFWVFTEEFGRSIGCRPLKQGSARRSFVLRRTVRPCWSWRRTIWCKEVTIVRERSQAATHTAVVIFERVVDCNFCCLFDVVICITALILCIGDHLWI